jgi:hypothetical protein
LFERFLLCRLTPTNAFFGVNNFHYPPASPYVFILKKMKTEVEAYEKQKDEKEKTTIDFGNNACL